MKTSEYKHILIRIQKRISPFTVPVTFLIIRLSGYIPSHALRKCIYRMFGLKIGKGSSVYMGAEIRAASWVKIGVNSSVGHRAILDGRGHLSIGDNVNLSTGVWIWTSSHDVQSPLFAGKKAPVVIEDYVWLSCRSIVLPGVTIGRGAVVAAGAVVSKDVAPFSIVAGIPAVPIGIRNEDLSYDCSAQIHMI